MHVLVVELGQDKPLIKEQSNLKVLYALGTRIAFKFLSTKDKRMGSLVWEVPLIHSYLFWATACQTIATLPT